MGSPKPRISHMTPINLCRTLNKIRTKKKMGERDLWVGGGSGRDRKELGESRWAGSKTHCIHV